MGNKHHNIGLKQATELCRMGHKKRLKFLAEGLPVIQESAEGYWKASLQLREFPREAEVLSGYAVEEAAKILVLLDAVRCPKRLVPKHIGKIVGWFYNHLARLIYAEATGWRPTDVTELRTYVEELRKSHSVEGVVGEVILPNLSLFMRESQLYADIACAEGGDPYWSAPSSVDMGMSSFEPPALTLTKAMSALGMFSAIGLTATSEVWGATTFCASEDRWAALSLTRQLVNRLVEQGSPTRSATDEHFSALFDLWQLPMYDFDLKLINVPLQELKDLQEQSLIAEMGLP